MHSLSQLQQNFISHIQDQQNQEILKILPYNQEEALERLDIYRNNVIGNLESVLACIYEVTKKIVGDHYFAKLVKDYIAQYSSTSANLDDYGAFFSSIVSHHLHEHHLLYLEDIAKLEWHYHESYFKEDIEKDFDVESFQKLDEEDYEEITFTLHPSCILFESPYSIFSIWKNNIEDNDDEKISCDVRQFVIIERLDNRCAISALNHEEFLFLSLLKKGCKLFETYEEINRILGFEVDIGSLLNKFIANRVISRFNK